MVSSEVVMQTVKRMVSSGVDDSTIRMTLKSINLSDAEIDTVLSQAKGLQARQATEPVEQEQAESEAEYPGAGEGGEEAAGEEEDTEGTMREEAPAYDVKSAFDEQSAAHAATQGILGSHSEQLGEIHKDVAGLHEKISTIPAIPAETIGKINALDSRLSELEKQVSETKGNTEALKELLRKILETDRKTLVELEKRK